MRTRGRTLIISIGIIALLCCPMSAVRAQLFVDIEGGVVSPGYNDVRVPGTGGTPFSLKDDLKPTTTSFWRVRPGIRLDGRHNIMVLYAPLAIKSRGTFESPVMFDDVLFEPERVTNADYIFNSYRVTYRYDLVTDLKLRIGVGVTAKIRDASITLTNSSTSTDKRNIGFVPLINFYMNWKLNDRFGFLLDGDALVGPQGRAEDVFLGLTYEVAGGLQGRLGYRVLEGGGDVDEVYNFALIHYAALGATFWL